MSHCSKQCPRPLFQSRGETSWLVGGFNQPMGSKFMRKSNWIVKPNFWCEKKMKPPPRKVHGFCGPTSCSQLWLEHDEHQAFQTFERTDLMDKYTNNQFYDASKHHQNSGLNDMFNISIGQPNLCNRFATWRRCKLHKVLYDNSSKHPWDFTKRHLTPSISCIKWC